MSQARFITLEGIEGAGKTTVADRITQSLRKRGITPAVKPKDRFAKPTPAGYRDMLWNVKFSNGHVGELQIQMEERESDWWEKQLGKTVVAGGSD